MASGDTTSIGVGINARGRIGFVTSFTVTKSGKSLYRGFDIFGIPWQTTCLRPVSWRGVIRKLKWRVGGGIADD